MTGPAIYLDVETNMPTTYKIDPQHSSANFVVRHMMITNVHGGFGKLHGTVVWDPAALNQSSVEATVDAASIDTREPDRDKHLRSADFFDVEKFPAISFLSTGIESSGDGELKIAGTLTIHGVSKAVVLAVDGPTAEGKDPWGNSRIGASATTKIKRSEFGLTWNSTLETGGILVGDDIKIEIEVSLIRA
jgi:polyisoprenoid-binding protein YceI